MKYLKLFENYKVDKDEFPFDGYSISTMEKEILENLVGDIYLKFNIKKDDGYYYTNLSYIYYNRFESFNDLKDYIQFHYFIGKRDTDSFINLLKTTNLDMSFDNNFCVIYSSIKGYTEIVKILLEDPNVLTGIVKLLQNPAAPRDPSARWASRYNHREIVKLLSADPRFRDKLSVEEINKYLNEIS